MPGAETPYPEGAPLNTFEGFQPCNLLVLISRSSFADIHNRQQVARCLTPAVSAVIR